MANTSSEKILARLKGLSKQMRVGEQPLFSIPSIWENATEHQSYACDLVLTNQRLFGYIYTTFPRERLFLDALELDAITAVSLRQKNFSAMFRELLVSDAKKRIYIRATGKKIEDTYTSLRLALADYAPATSIAGASEEAKADVLPTLKETALAEEAQALDGASLLHGTESDVDAKELDARPQAHQEPVFKRQHIERPLESSPLGISLLLTCGLILEIVGILTWIATGSAQTGGSLLFAGIVAVVVAVFARRRLR